jgi:hypothetical protein
MTSAVQRTKIAKLLACTTARLAPPSYHRCESPERQGGFTQQRVPRGDSFGCPQNDPLSKALPVRRGARGAAHGDSATILSPFAMTLVALRIQLLGRLCTKPPSRQERLVYRESSLPLILETHHPAGAAFEEPMTAIFSFRPTQSVLCVRKLLFELRSKRRAHD